MNAKVYFLNDFEDLIYLEEKDGFIEIPTPFEFAVNFQVGDILTYTFKSCKGEDIEVLLLVEERIFDISKSELFVECSIGLPIEGNNNGLGYGQSLN